MKQIAFKLEDMFDKLFGRRSVSMDYLYNSGIFIIVLDEEVLPYHLEDVNIIYSFMKNNNLLDKFQSYESMIQYMYDEEFYDEIFKKVD